MPKFSKADRTKGSPAAVRTAGPTVPTSEGGIGYARDAKSELFLLAVSNMVAEATFYEQGGERDERFAALVATVTAEDRDWMTRFVPFLRNVMQMRSASVVAAAEYVHAGGTGGRGVVESVLQRADEPAEILAYWVARYGRRFPQPLKRGVADAVGRLFTQASALKYDGQSRGWRMGDVVELTHPRPRDEDQSTLFRYLIERRQKRPVTRTGLATIDAATELAELPIERRRDVLDTPDRLAAAAMTWERLSGWLQGPMDAKAWEAMIPSMGYMALLRNLRNFDEAGISDGAATTVASRLADPDEVARSRQFPIRFYSAWAATESMRWATTLEAALGHSLKSVPALGGRTLILVDVSGSMKRSWSRGSTVEWWQVAAVFGSALGFRADRAQLFAYSNTAEPMKVPKGGAILRSIPNFMSWKGAGGGTKTMDVLRQTYDRHDRVVILTDEQAFRSDFDPAVIPVPIYTFNLVGYRAGHLPSGAGGRYTFAGLTDAGFAMLRLLEETRDGSWPF